MHNFDVSCETQITYRREQLQRASVRRPAKDPAGNRRPSWFARLRTTETEPGATAAVVTLAVPGVGTAEFDDWAAEVGQQFAERGVLAVKRQLDALTQLAQRHGVAPVARAVLADRGEHEVARARAFLRVVAALGQLTPVTLDSVDVAA